MINYHLSQKTKLLENDGFNHLTDILSLHLTCVPNLPSISEAQQLKFLSFLVTCRIEIGFKLKTSCFETMINYHLSQKLKLLGNDQFNHLNCTTKLSIEQSKKLLLQFQQIII